MGRLSRSALLWFALAVVVQGSPVDQHATPETRNLLKHLTEFARNPHKILFGHHADTFSGCYGGHSPYHMQRHDGHVEGFQFTDQQANTHYPDELSDCKSVTGQYPAMVGFEFWQMEQPNLYHYLVRKAHARGQVITMSQHMFNPVTGGSAWINQDGGNVWHTVKRILPGGDHHAKLQHNLDKIANWAHTLKDSQGKLIPFIYRPLHELNGDWFWWSLSSKTGNTPTDLKNLYRFIVSYMRDTKKVHNMIYAFAPNKFHNKADYLKTYPGDDYVDIMATDFYYDQWASVPDFKRSVEDVVQLAEAHKKVPALAEVGYLHNGLNHAPNFWNDHVLDVIKSSHIAPRIAYMHSWSNQCYGNGQCDVWIPYKGHPAESQFRTKFFNDPTTYFVNQIGNMYMYK